MPQFRNESDVKREIKKLLNRYKWFYWMPAANAFGKVGAPDFLALRGGVFLGIEAKFGKNKPTAPQRGFGQSILAEGGFSFVVNEDLLPVLERWFQNFDKSISEVQDQRHMSDDLGAALLEDVRLLTEMLT